VFPQVSSLISTLETILTKGDVQSMIVEYEALNVVIRYVWGSTEWLTMLVFGKLLKQDLGGSECSECCFSCSVSTTYRVTEWPGLQRPTMLTQFQPPAMCRVANQQPRLPRATSSLALNACRDGASTASLGNLFSVAPPSGGRTFSSYPT